MLDRRLVFNSGGGTGGLTPNSTLTTTKSASNPTFNFNAVPESMVKDGSTYYALYLNPATSPDEYRIASSSSRQGPWTDVGMVLTLGSQSWEGNSTELVAYLMPRQADGLFYIFYSIGASGTGQYAIGYATSSTIAGPYTKYASNPVFTPGSAGTWNSLGVGEMSVIVVGSQWIMAFMGNKASPSGDLTEQVGLVVASGPNGPWTEPQTNPIITPGSAGSVDANGCADPSIFFVDGYFWTTYAAIAGPTAGLTLPWTVGLAYTPALDQPWTKYRRLPIIGVGSPGDFDSKTAWRAFVYPENGSYEIIYGGLSSDPVNLLDAKGGNATLNISN